MATSKNTPATVPQQDAAPPAIKQNNSERFTNMVFRQFGQNVSGAFQVTDAQKRLIQGYFIVIDRVLKTAEENRLSKNASNRDHKWDNPMPCTWENVNLQELALDLMHYARMGLDMMQDNHLSPIPYATTRPTGTTSP
jgi:recombination protein RecT